MFHGGWGDGRGVDGRGVDVRGGEGTRGDDKTGSLIQQKYFCRTCISMGDLGVQVSVRPFVRPSTVTLGVL